MIVKNVYILLYDGQWVLVVKKYLLCRLLLFFGWLVVVQLRDAQRVQFS